MTQETKAPSRNSRDSETHDKMTRRKPWRPVRKLETPPAPPGFTYRWIRESMLGQEDRANVSRRLREGWRLFKSATTITKVRVTTQYRLWTIVFLTKARKIVDMLSMIPKGIQEYPSERNNYVHFALNQ